MMNSTERMSYITDYIGAYETKIKLSNKNGLFDSAKLFEVFAIEVCSIWFGQSFINLNETKPNYPYVDLLSNDKEIFVQVSTVQNIPCKIKETLEKVKNGKQEIVANIKEVYFFVLHNESVDDVKDYTGDNQIGKVEFKQEKHLITTQKIVERAMNNLDFQIALHTLLEKDDKKVCELTNRLSIEFENSKNIGLNNIDSLINDEYEIDRSQFVEKIKNANNQFVSVRGEAGSGKSVICKKAVEEEPCLLFARAERFVEETDLNEIWHLNLSDSLKYLNNRRIVFFIDSLEFIADASKSKIDLLQSLFELVSNHSNAVIITSCRSCDETAFFAIDSKYFAEKVFVDRLNIIELNKIVDKYPIIELFMKDDTYSDLVTSPFYLNLIIKNITDYSSVTDENKLRNYIWENVICLKNKAQKYGVLYNEVVKEINKIVFERAKTFSLGVKSENINHKVLRALVSENVIIENDGTVRLKYDIFEDISFEQNIDSEFDLCRGVYSLFFDKIEGFGRCCYRRYQIWISNKIFTKSSRDKFLYNLVFSKSLPDKWTKQTIIGLVKSRFCTPFFEEQSHTLLATDLVQKFIDITNLFAFEAQIIYLSKEPQFLLNPKGMGRVELIKIIFNYELYKQSSLNNDSIVKLCSDYANNEECTVEISKMSHAILAYNVEKVLGSNSIKYYDKSKKINSLLLPIYLMSEHSKEWIIKFWSRLKTDFLSDDHEKRRIAEAIFEHTLNRTVLKLAKNLPNELCDLANMFWTAKLSIGHMFYGSEYDSPYYDYGLNKNAESYEHSRESLHSGSFFNAIFNQNFWIGLKWAIDFINNAVNCFVKNNKDNVVEISLYFSDKNTTQKYYATPGMWLASSEEGYFPVLLGDIVYILRDHIIRAIKLLVRSKVEYKKFAFLIKEAIFEKSNNIMLFSIIEDVGLEFEKELPGFALDLATSIEIVYWDNNRFVSLNPSEEANTIKKNIFTIMSMPYLKGRYEDGFKKKYTLQDYVCHMQFDSQAQGHCYKVLDYLYGLYPNDETNAREHLQVQKMDLRTAEVEVVDYQTISISPTISGNAKKIVEANKTKNKSKTTIDESLKDFYTSIDPNNYNVKYVNDKIDQILQEIENVELPFLYDEHIIMLVTFALNKEELEDDKREEYCEFWINGVEGIFENQNFTFNYGFLFVLFRQVKFNLRQDTKNKIKSLILKIICYVGGNGLIIQMRNVTNKYLKTDKTLSNALFNTIIALSSDEYQHQFFNYNYLVENGQEIDGEFIPNLTPKFKGVDMHFNNSGEKGYCSRRDEYLEKYLFNEADLNLSDFDISKHDVSTLCSIVNTGVCLEEDKISVLKELIMGILNVYNFKHFKHRTSSVLDGMCSMQVSDYLGEALFENSNVVLEMMFENVDFSVFRQDSIDFYLSSFHQILWKYVTSNEDFETRKKCESVLLKLEEKINSSVKTIGVKHQLYRALIMSISGYEGDWSDLRTGYTFSDVQFLNTMFTKYGKYNFKYFIYTIYKMHFKDLLPYIMTSISTTVQSFTKVEYFNKDDFDDVKTYLDNLIVVAFLNCQDEIKQDDELTKSYELLLETLVDYRFEDAAVLLDEFRIH